VTEVTSAVTSKSCVYVSVAEPKAGMFKDVATDPVEVLPLGCSTTVPEARVI
jgi:hypothetical protein